MTYSKMAESTEPESETREDSITFPTCPSTPAGLLSRIQNYLGNGGLFNPEYMEHDKVRDLILDIRAHLLAEGGGPDPHAR